MKSSTTPDFRRSYAGLSPQIKSKVRKAFRIWKRNPRHPSLRFKKVGGLWSARIDDDHRALALMDNEVLYWFWIGNHDEYERLITTWQ